VRGGGLLASWVERSVVGDVWKGLRQSGFAAKRAKGYFVNFNKGLSGIIDLLFGYHAKQRAANGPQG